MENCNCGFCCHLDLDFLERQAGRVPQIPVRYDADNAESRRYKYMG